MKRILFAIPLLFSLAAAPAFAELTKIADNVYSYVGVKDASPATSFAANAGVVIGRDGVLVVDTLISAKEGKRFLADIRKVTDKPIKYVVNTHGHLDHAFGNCVFTGIGATVIAHEADRELLEKKGDATLKNAGAFGLTPQQMEGTVIALPTITFSDRMQIDLGGEKVELIRVAPSHTEGSLIVYLPAEKVLFSGDVLFTDFHPFLADGDLGGWIKTLDAILAMNVEKVVPGHGPLSTKKDVKEMREYITLFDATAKNAAAKGESAEAIAAELKRVLPKRSQAEWMIDFNVKSRYTTSR